VGRDRHAFERLEGLVESQRRIVCAGKRHRHLILHELSNADEPQGKEYLIPAELIVKASTGPTPLDQAARRISPPSPRAFG
jgi:hypothetical protein